jgi:hypothetical protein
MSSTPHTNAAAAPSAESLSRGHETRDVNPRTIIWLGVAVMVGVLVVQVLLWLLLSGLNASATRSDAPVSPLTADTNPPPGPRLQSNPREDYKEYRRKQEAVLGSYGWIDRQQGVVHIPIARAMDLILEQGLPKPSEKEKEKDTEKGKEKEKADSAEESEQ